MSKLRRVLIGILGIAGVLGYIYWDQAGQSSPDSETKSETVQAAPKTVVVQSTPPPVVLPPNNPAASSGKSTPTTVNVPVTNVLPKRLPAEEFKKFCDDKKGTVGINPTTNRETCKVVD